MDSITNNVTGSAVNRIAEDDRTKKLTEDINQELEKPDNVGLVAKAKRILGGLAEASIVNIETGKEIKCMFCPKEYTISKTNSWGGVAGKGNNTSDPEFKRGEPATLTMDLFFDTYETKKDVRKEYTDKIWKLMLVDPELTHPCAKEQNPNNLPSEANTSLQQATAPLPRPPLCKFIWGKTWSFTAVITSITQNYTLFLPDGTPVRAKLAVTFGQAKDMTKFSKQNPTTGGGYGYKTHLIKEGETIDLIAYNAYGSSASWRFLADNNKLDNPLKLKAGQFLTIVPLS